MCYDAEVATKRQLKEAIRLGADQSEIDFLAYQLMEVERKRNGIAPMPFSEANDSLEDLPHYYHVSGFKHPYLSIISSLQPTNAMIAHWGFIPHWVESFEDAYDYKKKSNCNLNAQSENMFKGRAFKTSAKYKRCVIQLDSYYEHHKANGTTYPFRIRHVEEKPLWFAGIYANNELLDTSSGEIVKLHSFAILTCQANDILSKIHNNPEMVARTGHRMLVILDEDHLSQYLEPYPETKDPVESAHFENKILNLCRPYDEELLTYHPVRNLRSRKDSPYLGNVPEIREPYYWEDLDLDAIFC